MGRSSMTFGQRYTPADPKQRQRERISRMAVTMGQVRMQWKPSVSMEGSTTGPAPKQEEVQASAKEIQAHKRALVELGCMVCKRLFPWMDRGPVELHHLRGGGWGRGNYLTLIPLCTSHHRGDKGVHGLGTKGFAKHYGFDQAELLMDALTLAGQTKKEPNT
jgi:hypothetical protein